MKAYPQPSRNKRARRDFPAAPGPVRTLNQNDNWFPS